MKNLNDIVRTGGNTIELPSGEFKGTLIIDKPCTVKGNSTTVWNNDGSVIEIRSQGVKLCGIRAEITLPDSEYYCINSYYADTMFENIEISGNVKGIKNEELQWIIPKSISLGNFKSETVNTFQMEIYVPTETEIYSNISGIEISPEKLSKGRNIITLKTAEIKENVCIYGELILKSGLLRRIYVSGKSLKNAEKKDGVMLYKAEEPSAEKNVETDFSHIVIPQNTVNHSIQHNEETKQEIKQLRKGERIYIDDIADDVISVEFNYRKMLTPLDIDPYVFLLDKDNTVPEDSGFVFFSNPVSANAEVVIQPSENGKVSVVDINLKNVPDYINKISVAYSIYINNSRDNFSKLSDPFVAIRSKGNIKYFFTADDLMMETTIIFFEIYRHNLSWKMNMVGAGYKSGLTKLCESYGLKVGY
ncbi:MAG: TerD family protein [Oscillospiraceae bacterium]